MHALEAVRRVRACVHVQASLSAALLVTAYLLQQRLCPFLISSTLSSSLALSEGEIESRLAELRQATGGGGSSGSGPGSQPGGSTRRASTTVARRRSMAQQGDPNGSPVQGVVSSGMLASPQPLSRVGLASSPSVRSLVGLEARGDFGPGLRLRTLLSAL